MVHDWVSAKEYIEGGRYPNSHRKIANNTYVVVVDTPDGDALGIKLHNTVIVTYMPQTFVLNSGGWKTVTTKDRINKFTCIRIHQKDHQWYLDDGTDFVDGMVFEYNGKHLGYDATYKYYHSSAPQVKLGVSIKPFVDGHMGKKAKKLSLLNDKVSSYLSFIVPGLYNRSLNFRCPDCKAPSVDIMSIVVHLNDSHRLSFGEIADRLDAMGNELEMQKCPYPLNNGRG